MFRNTLCDVCLVLVLAWTATSVAEVPFGHADWKPSPTDPVGLAGQGNSWFPGAAPPLEWSETTNGVSSNIFWKVPIPGWTDVQPLVVPAQGGRRVIGLYSPHHVVCYDAATGKVLWRDELKIMALPAVAGDRKTLTPAPSAEEAAKLQDLFERGLASYRIMFAAGATYTHRQESIEPRAALIHHIVETLKSWRPHFEQTMPDAVKPLDDDLALYALCTPGNEEAYKQATNDRRQTPSNLMGFMQKKTGVNVGNNWQGSVSDVMASPVSDGEVVCVALGFGQLAGYGLATGKRLWAHRDPLLVAGAADHCASPLLWKDLFIVPSAGIQKDRNWYRSLRALDKRTGELRWEAVDLSGSGGKPWGAPGTHGYHMSPCLGRLPDGKGGMRAIVVSSTGHIVDAESGQSLGALPADKDRSHWGAGFICILNDRLYRGYGADNYNPALAFCALRFAGDGTLESGQWQETELPKIGQGPFAVSPSALVGSERLADPLTGKELARLGRFSSASIAGNYVLLAETHGQNTGPKGDVAGDMLPLRVRVIDITDPTAPRVVGTNLIEARGYTPDITATYFPKFASDAALRRWGALKPGHVNYQGIGFNFATDTAGITASGNRLYLHAPSWLYCIGEK